MPIAPRRTARPSPAAPARRTAPAPAPAPRRAAPAPARPPARAPASAARPTFHRGAEGMARAEEEIRKAKERAEARREQAGKPFRARVPVGETREFIILDEKPDFFMYEHSLKGADGRYNVFTGCVKETENCPVCASTGKESYYAMFLSVIDLTPFSTRQGEQVDFSRKLFVVKNQQQKKFMRMYQTHGSLRGLRISCSRDGEKEPAIGSDIQVIDTIPDEELATYTRVWTDRQGKQHTEDCSEPFDYEELFSEPDPAELRNRTGAAPTPGSREADAAALSDDDGWDDPDADGSYSRDVEAVPQRRRGAVPQTPAARTAPARSTTRRTPPPPQEEETVPVWTEDDLKDGEFLDDEGNIVDEDGNIIEAAPEAPTSAQANDDEDEGEPEPAPVARRTAPAPRRGAPVRTSRTRSAPEEADDAPTPRRGAAPSRPVTFRRGR